MTAAGQQLLLPVTKAVQGKEGCTPSHSAPVVSSVCLAPCCCQRSGTWHALSVSCHAPAHDPPPAQGCGAYLLLPVLWHQHLASCLVSSHPVVICGRHADCGSALEQASTEQRAQACAAAAAAVAVAAVSACEAAVNQHAAGGAAAAAIIAAGPDCCWGGLRSKTYAWVSVAIRVSCMERCAGMATRGCGVLLRLIRTQLRCWVQSPTAPCSTHANRLWAAAVAVGGLSLEDQTGCASSHQESPSWSNHAERTGLLLPDTPGYAVLLPLSVLGCSQQQPAIHNYLLPACPATAGLLVRRYMMMMMTRKCTAAPACRVPGYCWLSRNSNR